jgi:hypothetical protein
MKPRGSWSNTSPCRRMTRGGTALGRTPPAHLGAPPADKERPSGVPQETHGCVRRRAIISAKPGRVVATCSRSASLICQKSSQITQYPSMGKSRLSSLHSDATVNVSCGWSYLQTGHLATNTNTIASLASSTARTSPLGARKVRTVVCAAYRSISGRGVGSCRLGLRRTPAGFAASSPLAPTPSMPRVCLRAGLLSEARLEGRHEVDDLGFRSF